MFCVGFQLLLCTLYIFTSLEGRNLILNVHSVRLGACTVLDTGVRCYPRDHLYLLELSGCCFVPEGDFLPHPPPELRLLSGPGVAGSKCQEPNPPQDPSANASGECNTPAPSPSAGIILTVFPCGIEALLPSMEAVFIVSLGWPSPLPCILSIEISYLRCSLCPLLEEPKLRQYMVLTQYLWKGRILT